MARFVNGGSFTPGADRIGLVFPVYNHLIPHLVQRFVKRCPSLSDKTVFAVCTYGDSPCISLEYLQRLVANKGGTLSGGFGVRMPYNYISPSRSLRSVFQPFRLREIPAERQNGMISAARERLTEIAAYVLAGNNGTLEIEYARIEHLSDRLNLRNTLQKSFWLRKAGVREKTSMTSVECVQLMDAGFFATDACTGCGTCVRVCPVQNIRFQDNRPGWLHRCEQCFACLQWCPAQAIQFGEGTRGCKRYHHPSVKLEDIAIQQTTNEE